MIRGSFVGGCSVGLCLCGATSIHRRHVKLCSDERCMLTSSTWCPAVQKTGDFRKQWPQMKYNLLIIEV